MSNTTRKIRSKYKTVDVTVPRDGRVVKLDRYWLCAYGDPTQAVYYSQSAQCNSQEVMMQGTIRERAEKVMSRPVKIVFIPIAYALG